MRRFVMWFESQSIWVRLFIQSILTAIPFYFAAFLSYSVANAAQYSKPYSLGLHAAVFVVLLVFVIFSSRMLSLYSEHIRLEREQRRNALLQSYKSTDRIIADALRQVDLSWNAKDRFVETFISSTEQIQKNIEAVYNLFSLQFGSADSDDTIDFDASFMTKSYIDNLITIPAYANRDGRSKKSLMLRETTNPHIYEDTISASMYRQGLVSPRIIQNTEDKDEHYVEIYPDEKKKIKSTIVYPILSSKNEILGTLVVYCDQENFFCSDREKFWCQLLEVFAKRIAVEKMKMDALLRLAKSGTLPNGLSVRPPY